LADARAGAAITPNEWRMLAFHSWEVDDSGLVAASDRAGVLAELAARSPAGDGETSTRLWLRALAASDDGKGLKPDPALADRVARVLADPVASRLHMDVLTGGATSMVRALTGEDSAERAALVGRFDAALARLQVDVTLSRGDRVGALLERVNLARIDQPREATAPRLPDSLLGEVRDTAARMDREITDGYERQAVITEAAYMLAQAGLWSDSDGLLRTNLARSHSPYYLMSELASNARKLGKASEALAWYQRAYDASVGPATRLQWGASYVGALIDLSPADAARIESAASAFFADASRDGGAFHDRSARALQRVGRQLRSWNADGAHEATMKRLRARVDTLCTRAGAQERSVCRSLLARSD
jgi:hypothetical protein